MASDETSGRILATLNLVPIPSWEEQHLCPCYEQLVGAAYSLVAAESLGVRTRSLKGYHHAVRVLLPNLLAAGEFDFQTAPQQWKTWASGFYFNAAIQRIVWVGDRILTVFGRLPATCCIEVPQVRAADRKKGGFRPMVDDATARLAHEHLARPSGIRAIVDMLERNYDAKKNEVTDQNLLRAIRWDVNQRKHAIGGFHRSSAGATDRGPWVRLEPEQQYEYAVKAFELISNAYTDLHSLYFDEQILARVRSDSASS